MSNAETMGIQQVERLIFALFANLKVGAAISATTAGRMPRNMAAIHGTSINWWKNIAMSKIMRNEGNTAPKHVHNAPRVLRSLYPMKMLMLARKFLLV